METIVRVFNEHGLDLFEATAIGLPMPKVREVIFMDTDNDGSVRVQPESGKLRVHGVWSCSVVDTQYNEADGCLVVDCIGTLVED